MTVTVNAPTGSFCACCDREYCEDDAICMVCHTPRSLSERLRSRGVPPQFVTIVGASGAGKTVYLGLLLDLLSQGVADIQGVALDPYSVAVQEQTVAALQDMRFPEKTPSESDSWNWACCRLSRPSARKKALELVTPDLAGEAIACELERPGTYPAIGAVLSRSRAIVLLCDAAGVRDRGLAEDIFGVKLLSYLAAMSNVPTKASPSGMKDVPLAIVFTKCDSCPEARLDPEEFALSNTPRLMRHCEHTFANRRVFAASVVGSSGTLVDKMGRQTRIPFHVEPRGVLEPIEWIMNQCA